jgi:transposase-like protein
MVLNPIEVSCEAHGGTCRGHSTWKCPDCGTKLSIELSTPLDNGLALTGAFRCWGCGYSRRMAIYVGPREKAEA